MGHTLLNGSYDNENVACSVQRLPQQQQQQQCMLNLRPILEHTFYYIPSYEVGDGRVVVDVVVLYFALKQYLLLLSSSFDLCLLYLPLFTLRG